MRKLNILFLVFLSYSFLYPGIIWTLETENVTPSTSGKGSGADLNIGVSDSVSFSVTHDYLWLTLPVYVNGMEVRLFNKLWMFSVVMSVLLLIYMLNRYYYDKRKSKEPISDFESDSD